jgi:hypothetical protein
MMESSEYWSGVMTGVFGFAGFTIVVSLLAVWLLARNAPTVPDHWDV